MNQFTVKKKLYIIFGIILSLTLALGIFSSLALKSQSKQTQIMLELTFADVSLFASRLAQADYMIQESPEYEKQAISHANSAIEKLSAVKSLMVVEKSITQV